MKKQAPERLTRSSGTERHVRTASFRWLLCWAAAAPFRLCLLVGCAAWFGGCGGPPEKTNGQPRSVGSAGGIEMVAVPAGWFEMGSANPEEPDQKLHKVYVSAFSMDKYPVTQEVYGKLMGKNPSLW